jgi:predicted CXXCH cytochrome family protein
MVIRRKYLYIPLALFFLVFISTPPIHSKSINEKPHLNKNYLPRGCASCHRGHGKPNTPMLSERKDVFCFRCHGHRLNIERTVQKGDITESVKNDNIQQEFEKPYRHPVQRVGIHKADEIMPERDPHIPRHVECTDCHHHHYVSSDNRFAGIKGVNRQGISVTSINFEYELCFKCHSYSANLPANQINKAVIFDTGNPSYHPVIAPGKNANVPSLTPPLSSLSMIKCTDCHNNDDPVGPRGAHGSIYRYLLVKNYTENEGPEGAFQYELCYHCHSRNSILNNESFAFHNSHIINVGTSCRTCHNPHGSTQYTHLIDFDNLAIRSSSSGQLKFRDRGTRAGQCFLTCHGKDHNPKAYP